MDYLPLPSHPSIPTCNVPFVCTSGYCLDAGPFHEFPARYLQSLRYSSNERTLTSDDILLSLIQTWLFFGTVSEFFQTEIDIHSFSKSGLGQPRLICTFRLTELREQWIVSQNLRARGETDEPPQQHLPVLIQALYACEQLERANLRILGLEEILLSIRILLCSLTITAKGVEKESPDLEHLLQRLVLRPFDHILSPIDKFPFLNHMVMNGWW